MKQIAPMYTGIIVKYRSEIDGLRAVAVLPVIFFHAGFKGFSGGFVGVDVFFVISGFLITSLLIEQKRNQTYSLISFYEKRARRILPAMYAVIFACLPFAWHVMDHAEFRSFGRSILAVLFFVSNIFFWKQTDYFDQAADLKPLLHTWSLGVEEQFYILFPLALSAVWAWSRRGRGFFFALMALISLIAAQVLSKAYPSANFFLPTSRVFELLIGSLGSFAIDAGVREKQDGVKGSLLSMLGMGLIIFSVGYCDKNMPFPSLWALLPTTGTFLFLVFCPTQSFVGRVFSMPLMRGVGLVSYSLYLWHQPLFAFKRLYALEALTPGDYIPLIILSVVLAILSWKYIEQPLRNAKHFPLKRFIKMNAVAFGVLLIVGLFFGIPREIPFRISGERAQFLDASKDNAHHLLIIEGEECYDRDVGNACILGDATQKPTLALWGDSHAGALTLSLHQYLKKNKRAAYQFTKTGCPPARDLRRADQGDRDQCSSYSDKVMEKLHDATIETVIVAARYPIYAEQKRFDNKEGGIEPGEDFVVWPAKREINALEERRDHVLQRYQETFKELLALSKKVVIVYPIPEVGFNVPKTLEKLYFKHGMKDFHITTSYDVFKERTKRVRNALDAIQNPNVFRIYPEKILCDTLIKDRCVVHHGKDVYYWDYDHLTTKGADLVVGALADILQK